MIQPQSHHRTETGAPGPAIAAGAGVDIFTNFADCVRATVHEGAEQRPDPLMPAHYARRYDIYRQLIEALKPVWQKMTARTEP